MIITIGGKAWSGKSTCSKLLAEKLGYKRISIGDLKKQAAEEMGISIQEFNLLGDLPENQEEFDLKYDRYQQGLDIQSNIILDSRLSYRCQPDAFKVFLDVDPIEWARRILGDHRPADYHQSLEETIASTEQRNIADGRRYMDLYQTNPWDLLNYDLVLDTSEKTAAEVVTAIIDAYEAFLSSMS